MNKKFNRRNNLKTTVTSDSIDQRSRNIDSETELCLHTKRPWPHHATRKAKLFRKRSKLRYEKPVNPTMWDIFSEYSKTSTVHGVRFLGEKKRHWIERTWWIIAFALSLSGCTKLILDTWYKWERFPVIVTFAETSTPIWQIPYPAVTICPETKVKQSIFNYTKLCNMIDEDQHMLGLTEKQLTSFKAVAQICRSLPTNLLKMTREDNTTSAKIFKELHELAPSLSDVMFGCEWAGQLTSCKKLFKEFWTDEGLCFTFNILNASEVYREEGVSQDFPIVHHNHSSKFWDIDHGYKDNVTESKIYPYRVFGASEGLYVYLKLYDQDIDYLCGGAVQGFKFQLHPAHEIPQISKYFYRVALDHEVIVLVKPNLMATSETLKHYSSRGRQCYFNSERPLIFFKIYTQRNCELECVTNITIQRCGCSGFAMPRNDSTLICGLSKMNCYKTVELKTARRFATGQHTRCDCLPACSSISYDAELSFAKYDLREFYRAKKKRYAQSLQYARIFISFKDNHFFAFRRSELYGKADFLANCGGLLGLFMGFSLLSIVEVVYYFTLRMACNLRRSRAQKKERLTMMTRDFGLTNSDGRY